MLAPHADHARFPILCQENRSPEEDEDGLPVLTLTPLEREEELVAPEPVEDLDVQVVHPIEFLQQLAAAHESAVGLGLRVVGLHAPRVPGLDRIPLVARDSEHSFSVGVNAALLGNAYHASHVLPPYREPVA